MKVFVQDPHIFLTDLGISLPAHGDADDPAVLEADHRTRVNWENFYFSCIDDKAMFDADPAASCGVLTDPVTRERFQPDPSSPRFLHDGTTYFFTSDSTHTVFAGMPDSLAAPTHTMLPRSGS